MSSGRYSDYIRARIGKNLKKRVEVLAEASETTSSEIVRIALRKYLPGEEKTWKIVVGDEKEKDPGSRPIDPSAPRPAPKKRDTHSSREPRTTLRGDEPN
jgi:hypothetical protein